MAALGAGCAGVIWRKNVAEASNDVGCKPITFDLLALFSFAHLPILPDRYPVATLKALTPANLRQINLLVLPQH